MILKDLVENSEGTDLCGFLMWCLILRPPVSALEKNRIIEIGAVKVVKGVITDKFSYLCKPGCADSI